MCPSFAKKVVHCNRSCIMCIVTNYSRYCYKCLCANLVVGRHRRGPEVTRDFLKAQLVVLSSYMYKPVSLVKES